MGSNCDNIDKIYSLSTLFITNEIKLSAWNNCDKREILALFLGNGDFVFYCFTDEEPVLKQVPWFPDQEHLPVSICFNHSGSSLLVVSQCGHLYIVPTLLLFDPQLKCDSLTEGSDITIYPFPYPVKSQKQGKTKTKSPNSSLSAKSNLSVHSSSSSVSSSGEPCNKNHSSICSCNGTDAKTNDNLMKLKEMKTVKTEIEPTALVWWHSLHSNKQIGTIATKTGEIIFVDLNSGLRIGNTSVNGQIKSLATCQDVNYETAFLLITLENKVQYKVILEQKDLNFSWPNKEYLNPFDDGDNSDDTTFGKGNYLPSARSRLQGLKQLSVEKIATLKQKLAETRSKAALRGTSEETNQKYNNLEPDYVWGRVNDVVLSPQMSQDRFVLAGYHHPTQFLSVHTVALDKVPVCTYKMPADVEDVLLCDSVIFTVSTNRTVVQVISSNVSQIKSSCWDFNPDSVLGKWDLKELSDGGSVKREREEEDSLLKPDVIPQEHASGSWEKVIGIYRRCPRNETNDYATEYNLDESKDEFAGLYKVENCVMVTNRGVYAIEREWSAGRIALNWILRTNELEKVEKLCAIFRLQLGKLLELAGDIRLANSDVTRAIAYYRVSECNALKIAVKLAASGHCGEVLKYGVPIMAERFFSDMSVTERIHMSNLVLMAYTQQILIDSDPDATKKFLDFLESNPFYDGILAVSVTGQSFLFKCLYKLMIHKGLILDAYAVLIKLVQRFIDNKSLQWTVNKDDFWTCLTETSLIEAMIYKSVTFPAYAEYVFQNADSLDLLYLERLLVLADPTSPYVRSVARTSKLMDESFVDNDDTECNFPFQKLVELFLVALMMKIRKSAAEEGYDRDLMLPSSEPNGKMDSSSCASDEDALELGDSISEQIWPIRKDTKESEVLKRKRESILSCGFGHSALIRNGSVYTWGQATKGCLGHGPTMSKYSSPLPITWLTSLKLEVSIVSCGKQHTVALTNNGLYAWGCSAYGQLGLGNVYESPHPRLVTTLANENIVTVKCGQYHTLALTGQGSVFAWGWGVHGQLGLGIIDDERTPKLVHTLREQVIIDIAAGHGHSLVLSDKGHVYSFGSSVYGQLGTGVSVKSSVPVHVKGINGRVTVIATGYFHNLAVTESNALYTWGISPLALRRRRQRMSENEKNHVASPTPESEASQAAASVDGQPPGGLDEDAAEENSDANWTTEKADTHLSPSLVDTRDIKGKIIQISCGCHHSILVNDAGSLYVWGRTAGQVENASQRELLKPTLFTFNDVKVEAVSCGSEFTAVQDKQTGKVFNWGSNSVGQLGVPVEESATKCLDGKLIMLKSNKRTIRIPQTSTISFLSPREVPDIPSSSFTYQTLSKHSSAASFSLSHLDPDGYSTKCLHFAIEKYHHIYNVNFILRKCLELGNYQAASKIALLENKLKQSMIYQLKGLQNVPKYHSKSLMSFEKTETRREAVKSPKVMTPDSEIHLFTDQGGTEELCDETNSHDISNSDDDVPSQRDSEPSTDEQRSVMETKETAGPEENYLNQLKAEYVDHAKFILETYMGLCRNHSGNESSLNTILETGIQFWTAEKLPMTALEEFLLQKLDRNYYDLGYLLFCQLKKDGQSPLLHQFSSAFLLDITARVLAHVEQNGSCLEYVDTMSSLISGKEAQRKTGVEKRKRGNQKPDAARNRKPESVVQALTERLRKQTTSDKFIAVPSADVVPEHVYYFSCGHWHSVKSLEEGCKLFERVNDVVVADNLTRMYDEMDGKRSADISCPSCVYNYIKQ